MKKYYCIYENGKELKQCRTESENQANSIVFLNKNRNLDIKVLFVNGIQQQLLNYN